jgi:DNA-directed RNA polymerase specialized sigma24 family protein
MPTCPHGVWWDQKRYANQELACKDCDEAAREASTVAYRKAHPLWREEEHAQEAQEEYRRAERAGTRTWDPEWWKEIRAIRIERRKAAVADLLSRLWVPPEIENMPANELPPRQRRALELWNAGLTYGEIKEQMGVSRTRAYQLVRAAKKRVHDYWGTWDPADFTEEDG